MPTKSLEVLSRSEPYQHNFDDVGRDVLWCAIHWFNFKAEFSNITTKMSDSLYVDRLCSCILGQQVVFAHFMSQTQIPSCLQVSLKWLYCCIGFIFFIPAVAACLKQGRIGNTALPKAYILVQIKEMRHCVPARELYRSW